MHSEKEIIEKVNTIKNSFGMVSSQITRPNTESIPCFPNQIVLYKNKSNLLSNENLNLDKIRNNKILFPEENSEQHKIIQKRLNIAGYDFEDFKHKKFVSSALINQIVLKLLYKTFQHCILYTHCTNEL